MNQSRLIRGLDDPWVILVKWVSWNIYLS